MSETAERLEQDDRAQPRPAQAAKSDSRWPSLPGAVRRPSAVIGLVIVGTIILIAAFPGFFAGLVGDADPQACDLSNGGTGPTAGHPFGFDTQGCDLFNNVMYGARASVTIGVLVVVSTVMIAIVLGCAAAYYRGWVDTVVSRLTDVVLGFPILVGLVVVLQTLQRRDVLTLSAVLTLFAWPNVTRLMRSTALGVADLEYVRAARELGAGPVRIVLRHVLPNAFSPVAAVSVLLVGTIITTESALTLLGVGLQRPAISWGIQLNEAQGAFQRDPHLLFFPSLFLTLTVLGFVLIGDALRTDDTARQEIRG